MAGARGPAGLALTALRSTGAATARRVTLTARNQLVEVAAGDRPRELGRRPTVRQANTLAVDPRSGRVLLASRTDGTLELVDP